MCLVAGSAWAQDAVEPHHGPFVPNTIVVGGGDSYEPFHYLADGQPTGFDVDLVRAIARVMGLDIEVRLAYWREIRDGDESRDSRTTWTAYNDVPGECEDCGHSEELGAFYPTGERNER